MYNKKTLSKATAELDKAKAPKKPKDIITDSMGQWKYPGLPTRIPSNNITMKGVGYPVLGVANNGQRKIMLPGADYTFPGADYVDEYPQMKKGGTKKKRKTKSIMGMNKLMQKGPLFQDYSKRIYDPNVDYFQKGGPQNNASEERFKKRLMKRYPGMQGVYGTEGENLSIIKDPNYKASDHGFGNIEFMFPGQDSVTYTDDYQYKNPTPDQYTTVYNPKGANRGDVFLDMMHGMRDDEEYQKLLQNFGATVKKGRGRDMEHWYNKEAQENPNYVQDGREVWDNNYIDGILRAELANKTIGRRTKGNDYNLERRGSTDEIRQAGKDIKKYLKTPQKPKQYAGPVVENNGFITPEYEDGGTTKNKKGTITNVKQNSDGSKTVQVKTKDGKYYEKIIPKQTTFAEDVKSKRINPIPEYQYKKEIEALPGHSMKAGSTHKQSIPGKIADVIFNPFTAAGFAVRGQEIPDFITTKIKNGTLGYYDNAGRWQSDRNPFDIAADLGPIGWSHSASDIMGRVINKPEELTSEDNLWDVANILTAGLTRIKPRFKLAKNTYVPANQYKFDMGLSNPATVNTQTVVKELLSNASGHGNFKNGGEFEQGGYIEADLTDDEIDQYRKGGYIVEDISVPELNQAQEGIIQISDPKEYAFRKKAYDDSLSVYNKAEENLKVRTALENKYKITGRGRLEFRDPEIIKYYGKQNGMAPIKVIHMGGAEGIKNNLFVMQDGERNSGKFKKSLPIPETDFSRLQKPDFIFKKPTQQIEYKSSKYPKGYQPYSLYGKVLDPEVYGYAESLNGKPVQVAQFGDTYAYKAKMDAYRKSGKYPWVKQKGGTKDKFATHIGEDGTVGSTNVHTDKKGNITTKVQDSKGITHYKVKTKDGKVFYKQDASTAYPENNSISPENYKIDPRQIEMNDGALQPVDDVWTLPIGMSSAGVKGTIGLVKGLTSLGRNAAKSSLVQAGKAGLKKSLIKSLPGSSINNLVASGFAGTALTDILTGKVAEPWEKANKSGKFSDYVDAFTENMYTALDAYPLYKPVGKGLKQLGKYATTLPGKLSKTKANSIPKRVTNIGLDTYSGDSFTPIRIEGENYKNAGQEWYNVDPADYPGMTREQIQKQGLQDASESLNYLFKKNPKYSKEIFDNVGDFNYKQFSEEDEALKKLKSSITSEPMLGKADVYSNAELQKKIQNHKNWRNEIDEIYKEYKKLDPSGNSSNSDLRNLHPHLKKRWDALKNIDKSITDKFITKEQEKLIRENHPELISTLDTRNNLSRNSLKRLGENGLEEPMSEEVINFLKSQNLYKEPNKNLLRFEPGKMNKLGGLVKAQKGGIVLKLTSKEIQDYIKQGYIVEDVD